MAVGSSQNLPPNSHSPLLPNYQDYSEIVENIENLEISPPAQKKAFDRMA
jgi:hypothetical protein